jgi:hypothetical protein
MDRGTGHTHHVHRDGGSIWSKPTSRRALLTGAGLAGAASLAGVLLRSTGARHAPPSSGSFSSGSFSPANLRKVKYFPIVNAGFEMWKFYNGAQYQADMQTAKNMGFNSFHIFLAARPGVFDFPNPTQPELNNLADFYNRAKTVGIKLGVTLFDMWWASSYGMNPYGHIAGAQAWAKAIIGALPDLANLSVIEIKNEIKLSAAGTYPLSHGFDSGWPSGTPQYGQVRQVATVWIQQMIPYIRSIAPGVPVTASTNGDPTTNLAAFVAAVKGTKAAPDWYDWHCYTGANPGLIYGRLQSAINVVGGAGRLYIGETGCASNPTGDQGALQGQQTEADYLQAVRWYCAQLGLPEPAQWILLDMLACTQFTSGQRDGLYDTRGAIKLSGKMYQAIPPGSKVPPIPVNGTMRGGNQPDANGNALPPRWYLYLGNNNDQPITSAIDTVNTYQGNPSILLTGSANTLTMENPPALMTNPITAPIPVAGQTYTWAAYLKASGSYGRPTLGVSWYGANDVFLGSTKGARLTLTSSFTRHSLQTMAPAGAEYARVLVETPNNAGSIWVANASWA